MILSVAAVFSGCSSGSSDSDKTDPSPSRLSVEVGPVNTDVGDTIHVVLAGEAFVSTAFETHNCAGLCCALCWYDDSFSGVMVRWRNNTTGATGTAISRYGTLTAFAHLWSARIALTPGENRLVITAADLGGDMVTKAVNVTTGLDLKNPEVITTFPLDGTGSVDLLEPVSVSFSESMDSLTINASSFTIRAAGGALVDGDIAVNDSATMATFTPSAYTANTLYTATLSTAITDVSGKPLVNPFTWRFTTGEADVTAPFVSSTNPFVDAENVSLTAHVSVAFSEPVDPASITPDSFYVLDAASQIVAGSVSASTTGSITTAIFTPTGPMQTASSYSATLTTAVQDIAGNRLPSDYTWRFTTILPDSMPPAVVMVDPPDGGVCVPLDARISVTFNEAMDLSSLSPSTFQVKDADSNIVNGELSVTSTSATLAPYARLAHGTEYRATLNSAIKDASANSLAGDFSWRFTSVESAKGNWNPLSSAGAPSGRLLHSAVWSGTEMIIWGGGWNDVTNSGARYHALSDTWQPMSLLGAPLARADHTAVWTGAEMIVWGGRQFSQPFNDGARYNPVTDSWRPMTLEGAPTPRLFHVSTWTGTEMIIWGGSDGFRSLNNGARYNPMTDTWLPMSSTGAPQFAYAYDWGKAIWTGTELVLLNRFNHNPDHGGRYNPVTDTWRSITTVGAPPAADMEAFVWNGSEVLVWGAGYFSAYNPLTDSWRRLSTACSPVFRKFAEAIWTGSDLIVWGGFYDQLRYETGGIYSPTSNAWLPTSVSGAPTPRSGHTAVWTGNAMLIWGGVHGVDSGGKYTP